MNDSSQRTTPDACREALAAVLKSRTFERSEQLRAFLQFICEEELAERGTQLNEYQIGVLVIGRPRDDSPGEDATVQKPSPLPAAVGTVAVGRVLTAAGANWEVWPA